MCLSKKKKKIDVFAHKIFVMETIKERRRSRRTEKNRGESKSRILTARLN